ncbi:uncharacterized protein LOC133335671 [Musca vetustissima]|uniref:uncharacterized protein LOC133335671 n=1 Tax=Musca vetustissima TaxID=27455 RepID=UPI002AB75D47|nr:uncharacterized protein LOC133335671 [Musca vetustissima]
MSDIDSPRLFRRERNLSNRNFNKRGSNHRRQSTESHSSIEPRMLHEINIDDNSVTDNISQPATPSIASNSTTTSSSSSLNITYSVNSDTSESAINHRPTKPIRKLRSYEFSTSQDGLISNNSPPVNTPTEDPNSDENQSSAVNTPATPDPAWLGVQQKRIIFEKFHASDNLKTSKFTSKSTQSLLSSERSQPVWHKVSSPTLTSSSISSNSGSYYVAPPGRVLVMNLEATNKHNANRHSSFHQSIDEEHTEDEVDAIEDEVADVECTENHKGLPEENVEPVVETTNTTLLAPMLTHSKSHEPTAKDEGSKQENTSNQSVEAVVKTKSKDFPRNYRSRPLTEIGGSQTVRLRGEKYTSLRQVIW